MKNPDRPALGNRIRSGPPYSSGTGLACFAAAGVPGRPVVLKCLMPLPPVVLLALAGCGGGGGASTGMPPGMTGGIVSDDGAENKNDDDSSPPPPSMPSDSMTPKKLISMLEAARAIPRLVGRSVTQSSNTDTNIMSALPG